MGGVNHRVAWALAAAVVVCSGGYSRARAADATCTKEDFEAVVEAASKNLRDLNSENRPAFQEKLRELKSKRKWTYDEFMQKATPFVRDDKTAVYDKTSDQLLSEISSMGQAGAQSGTADCALVIELRARMKALTDTQVAKWRYMFEKLDAELMK
jgi:hypothetical protein